MTLNNNNKSQKNNQDNTDEKKKKISEKIEQSNSREFKDYGNDHEIQSKCEEYIDI